MNKSIALICFIVGMHSAFCQGKLSSSEWSADSLPRVIIYGKGGIGGSLLDMEREYGDGSGHVRYGDFEKKTKASYGLGVHLRIFTFERSYVSIGAIYERVKYGGIFHKAYTTNYMHNPPQHQTLNVEIEIYNKKHFLQFPLSFHYMLMQKGRSSWSIKGSAAVLLYFNRDKNIADHDGILEQMVKNIALGAGIAYHRKLGENCSFLLEPVCTFYAGNNGYTPLRLFSTGINIGIGFQ